jgi:DNA polymerase-1
MVDFDVETDGLQPWSQKQSAFMYQFGDDSGAVEVLDPLVDGERIQWWFNRGADEGLRAWNTKFDRSFAHISPFDIPGDGAWHDGMLLAHAINENRSIALKSVANEVLGPGSDDLQKQVKDWLTAERRRRKSEAHKEGTELVEPTYADVPRDLMAEYAAEDIVLTRKVCDAYEPIIAKSKDLTDIVAFEHEVLDALWHVERRGFPVDDHGYHMLLHEAAENLEALEDLCIALAAEGGVEGLNPNSTAQIINALKGRKADLTYMVTKNGKLSADRENLEAVDDELAKAILEYRAERKVHGTYVLPYIDRSYAAALRSWKEPFIAPDGAIHANFRQVGTVTGRMSCSDPNLQNQPRDDLRLRYNFRAEEGKKLVTCDLSNVEMRVFAAYAGEGALLRTIKEGGDIHTLTAEMIGIRDRKRAGGAVETARQRGKTFNFSVVYGGGVNTIMKQQRVSKDEARLMLQRYKDAYPEVVRLQNRIAYRLADTGYIKSAWGRRFHVDPRDSYKAVNYLVQGTSADLLKAALIKLHKQGVPVVGCVHDEIIAHVDESDAEECRQTIIEALTDHPMITEKVPLEAEGDIVNRWSDAKPLEERDKDGRKTGRKYYFDPEWAQVERRYVK